MPIERQPGEDPQDQGSDGIMIGGPVKLQSLNALSDAITFNIPLRKAAERQVNSRKDISQLYIVGRVINQMSLVQEHYFVLEIFQNHQVIKG